MRKALIILGVLTDSDVEWMCNVGKRVTFDKGDSLISEGRALGSIYLLIDGLLEVFLQRNGKRSFLSKLHAGEFLGEISLLDDRPPTASVSALDKSTLLSITKEDLRVKLKSDLGFQARFYRAIGTFLAIRLRSTNLLLAGGVGHKEEESDEDVDEINLEILEQSAIAGKRFEYLQSRIMKS
ncbi:cyclic nucleotide-binding domain-containing protein [Verrucomicrobia bacterium]|jgi:CRP-like cAMP-binding protein|nr:cyclic nucleotide-binding domain-containing protein [Verrucomicrobiota bacterium]